MFDATKSSYSERKQNHVLAPKALIPSPFTAILHLLTARCQDFNSNCTSVVLDRIDRPKASGCLSGTLRNFSDVFAWCTGETSADSLATLLAQITWYCNIRLLALLDVHQLGRPQQLVETIEMYASKVRRHQVVIARTHFLRHFFRV